MLKNKIKKMILTPALIAGVSFSALLLLSTLSLAQDEETKQIRPNIQKLTTDSNNQRLAPTEETEAPEYTPPVIHNYNKKTAPSTPSRSAPRIPGELHKHSLGVGVGQTFLRSDLGDNGNDKITADIYYQYAASFSFDFVANAHYSSHSYLSRNSTIEGIALSIKAKGYQFDSFAPFFLGGVGFYLPSVHRIENGVPTDTRKQVVFGINAGAGVELRLNSEVTVGMIAHYHDPFDVRQDQGAQLEASYLKLLILASYTFN